MKTKKCNIYAWDEINGLYRMQLVDFIEHKKTCPHAGAVNCG